MSHNRLSESEIDFLLDIKKGRALLANIMVNDVAKAVGLSPVFNEQQVECFYKNAKDFLMEGKNEWI